MSIKKNEIKLFLTFFLIYFLFVNWVFWGEDSRFNLLRAVADEGRLDIESYFNNSGDRSVYKGHYYSNENPGISFLATPAYTAWKFIYNNFFPENFRTLHSGTSEYLAVNATMVHETTYFLYTDLGFFSHTSMILVSMFTSSFFGALTVLLIYKISGYLSKNENNRIVLVIVAGFGTLLFSSSLVFIEHQISAFFAFLSFYFLFKARVEQIKNGKLFLFSGLLIGFGITSSLIALVVAITNLIYILLTRKDRLLYYLIGGFIGLLPFLLYNYVIFNSPFVLTQRYLDQTIWGSKGSEELNYNPYATLRLLFYPEIGLFVFYPILLFSFIGLFYLYRKFRIESVLFFIIFMLNLILASSIIHGWWVGGSINPRYLTIATPFLVLPLIEVFNKFDERKVSKIILLSLVFCSIFINFLLLQTPVSVISETGRKNDSSFEQLNSFEIIRNPLYEHYWPLFLKNGIRSRVLEGLITDPTKIDIRVSWLQPTSGIKFIPTPFGFLTPRMRTLPIAIITLIVFLIWKNEIIHLTPKKHYYLLYAVFILIILLTFDLQI
jgi:hypothetical protein